MAKSMKPGFMKPDNYGKGSGKKMMPKGKKAK